LYHNFKKGSTNNDKGCGNDYTFSQKPQNDHETVVHVLEDNSSKTFSLFIQKNFDHADRFGDGRGWTKNYYSFATRKERIFIKCR
jgi:hypothetical protein